MSTPDSRARSAILLHGRQVPRLLHHHHRLLTRPDRRHLPRLHNRALPADGRKGEAHRGLFIPEEVDAYPSGFLLSGWACMVNIWDICGAFSANDMGV